MNTYLGLDLGGTKLLIRSEGYIPRPSGALKRVCTLRLIPYENNHTPSALRRGWLIGETDAEGRVLRYKRYDSGFMNQQEALACIEKFLDDYLETRPPGPGESFPRAMGLGVMGRVDYDRGIWLQIDPRRTEAMPASVLQLHPDCEFLLDAAAAQKIAPRLAAAHTAAGKL